MDIATPADILTGVADDALVVDDGKAWLVVGIIPIRLFAVFAEC